MTVLVVDAEGTLDGVARIRDNVGVTEHNRTIAPGLVHGRIDDSGSLPHRFEPRAVKQKVNGVDRRRHILPPKRHQIARHIRQLLLVQVGIYRVSGRGSIHKRIVGKGCHCPIIGKRGWKLARKHRLKQSRRVGRRRRGGGGHCEDLRRRQRWRKCHRCHDRRTGWLDRGRQRTRSVRNDGKRGRRRRSHHIHGSFHSGRRGHDLRDGKGGRRSHDLRGGRRVRGYLPQILMTIVGSLAPARQNHEEKKRKKRGSQGIFLDLGNHLCTLFLHIVDEKKLDRTF